MIKLIYLKKYIVETENNETATLKLVNLNLDLKYDFFLVDRQPSNWFIWICLNLFSSHCTLINLDRSNINEKCDFIRALR